MTHQVKVYFRFMNLSGVPANVYWMSHRTRRVLYCTLQPTHFVDINTFLGHCWIFEDANNGDCLLANGSCIFTPTRWREYLLNRMKHDRSSRLARKLLIITQPLHTLKGLSFNAIRNTNISVKDAESLVLPTTVKDELLHILKKRDCHTLHNDCQTCPFDLHKAHFFHNCTMASCLSLLKANSTGRLVRLPHKRLVCIRTLSKPS